MTVPLDAEQRRRLIRQRIADRVRDTRCTVLVYRTEWNGLDAAMPTSHWLECAGERIDLSEVSWEWGEADLSALEGAGFLQKTRHSVATADEFETATYYRVDAASPEA